MSKGCGLSPQGASPLDPTGGRADRGTVKQSLFVDGSSRCGAQGHSARSHPWWFGEVQGE